jgi:RNA polymerase sigma-70 factor (ECF subfamily)
LYRRVLIFALDNLLQKHRDILPVNLLFTVHYTTVGLKKLSKKTTSPKKKAPATPSVPPVGTHPSASQPVPAPKHTSHLEERAEEQVQKVKETSERQLEDKMLVRRARGGDQRAYAELVKRHKRGIERLIRPIVRNATSDEVEDLVQEALTKALTHLDSYSEEYAFSTWLYRIATNHAIDHLRRRRLSMMSISAPVAGGSQGGDDEGKDLELADDSWVPDDVLLASERSKLIAEAIEQLPENYKRIIKLRHNDDLEYDEIARRLGLPMGTVKVHLHRARAALGKLLEGKI